MRPANVEREERFERATMAYIAAGIFFMLLPGSLLGVWNLISIANRRALDALSPAWIQAHGHAQIFGWIGTFVLGIGAYSLSKMGNLPAAAVGRVWLCYALWTAGVTLRWLTNVIAWEWRITLPLSAILELAGFLVFLVFLANVTNHKANSDSAQRSFETWMKLVLASTMGFLAGLLLNAAAAFDAAIHGSGPAIAHAVDQRLLFVPAWGFLVVAVWGFNARWLPIFLGLRAPDGKRLLAALAIAWLGIAAALMGRDLPAGCALVAASISAASGLHIFGRPAAPPKTLGVHPSFPFFVRLAYLWLLVAACLTVSAAIADRAGGFFGASRHALTVGFLAATVFAIGQRILPAFCGARVLFSPRLMLASLALLNIGCALRVASEIPAYEGYVRIACGSFRFRPLSN